MRQAKAAPFHAIKRLDIASLLERNAARHDGRADRFDKTSDRRLGRN
jgi:hypothetical protein